MRKNYYSSIIASVLGLADLLRKLPKGVVCSTFYQNNVSGSVLLNYQLKVVAHRYDSKFVASQKPLYMSFHP